MKKYDMMTACLKQMVFDEFMSLYSAEIRSLLEQQSFLFDVRQARGNVSEDIEFCLDNTNFEFRKFKQRISNYFYECGAYIHYPEFRFITENVKKKGVSFRGKPYTAASASISIYYAIRFYQINRLSVE